MANRAQGKRLRIVAFLLIASVVLFSSPPIARADTSAISQAKDELQQLRELVDELDAKLGAADEKYNQVAEELKQTQAAQAKTRVELERTQKDLDSARNRLMTRLVEVYKGGNASMIEVLLGATDFVDLVNKYSQVARIGEQDGALVKQVEDYLADVADKQARLAQQAKDEKKQTAALAEAQQTVADQLAAQQKALQGKEVQLAQLQKEEAARQAELAAAARAAAAKAAAEAARRATTTTTPRSSASGSDSGGTGSTATTSHPPSTAHQATATSHPPTTAKPTTTTKPDSGDSDGSGSDSSDVRAKVVDIALQYLGVPYLWAGSSPSGFDCSGFVMYVFAKVGIDLPHSSAMQYGRGTHISRDELQPGDLVFFYSPISHVGLYTGDGKMVNSRSGGVRIDNAFWNSYVGATRILD